MTKTYTIAYTVPEPDGMSLLLAVVPDGQDVGQVAEKEIKDSGSGAISEDEEGRQSREPVEWRSVGGLVLTDDEPDDESRVIWRGHDRGWLTNENGVSYEYAVSAS